MFKRIFNPPNSSFFLFGPRGTGKSTWLKNIFKPNIYIDLLRSENFLELTQDPSLLRSRVLVKSAAPVKVVIDEIQRIPILLNEVHALLEDYPNQFVFALTGSSARKLRRSEANLLAGRCLTRHFFPICVPEAENQYQLESVLKYGSLPKIFGMKTTEEKEDYLNAYAQTYLKEEVQQEALVRNLPSYIRFLKHLSLNNGQVLNLSNISREAGIQRGPLENYMSIIMDTLMGTIIEPLHLRAKIKEVSTPKFYFFDCGIAEALSGNLGEPLAERVGPLFETLTLNELKVYNQCSKKNYEINYWGTPSQNEVDFILSKGQKRVGLEVKFSKKWKAEFSKGLNVLLAAKKIRSAYIVYNGEFEEIHDQVTALPFKLFCKKLYAGEII